MVFMKAIKITIPIELKSEMNIRKKHWGVEHGRVKALKKAIQHFCGPFDLKSISLPVRVTLCRHSPRKLDFDNLVGCFKPIRDQIADLIIPGKAPGRADNHPDLHFEYGQEKSKEKYVSISILPLNKYHD